MTISAELICILMREGKIKFFRLLLVVFLLFCFGSGSRGSRGAHVFRQIIFKRHLVTSCRSAKLKQIFSDARHTTDDRRPTGIDPNSSVGALQAQVSYKEVIIF